MEKKFEECIECPEILYEKYGKGEDKCAECIVENKEVKMKLAVVSTCHAKGYEQFGKKYFSEFFKYMPDDIDLHVFKEDWEEESVEGNVHYHNIEELDRWKNFHNKHTTDPSKHGIIQKGDKHVRDYRFNALGFSAKIFPLQIIANMKIYDWVISLDCDIAFKKELPKKALEDRLDEEFTAIYLGREDFLHSECGFVAYNMNKDGGKFINRMVEMYDSDEVFKLEGHTDCHVFDSVRTLFEDEGHLFQNLSEGTKGLHVWPKTWLSEYMDHLKGPAAKDGVSWLNEFPNTLLGQAVHTVSHFKPRTILDIGVLDGSRGAAFAKASLWSQKQKPVKGNPPFVHLWALDPFGDKEKEIIERLNKFSEESSEFSYTYINLKKNPDKWDPEFNLAHPIMSRVEIGKSDFAFVDGEHTRAALTRDLTRMTPHVKMVMSPTYYLPDAEGKCPDTNKVGCNDIIETIPYKLLPAEGKCEEGGIAKAVVFGPAISPGFGKVQTKNAVPDEVIHKNIEYSIKHDPMFIQKELDHYKGIEGNIEKRRPVPFIRQCYIHSLTGLIIAGGPTVVDPDHPDYEKNWEKIKEVMDKEDVRTYVVKTTHDHMIYEKDLIPDACILLDPRGHVKDFIETPHPDVAYYASSMCDSSTWDVLLEKAPKLFGYNAAVKAGEIEFVAKTIGFNDAVFFGGGSSSATRGIGILHGLGFRKFVLAGWDQCWWDETKIDMDEKDPQGRNKYMKITLDERPFITQPILLAAAQDFETSYKEHNDLEFEVITDGMIDVIWNKIRKPKKDFFHEFDV